MIMSRSTVRQATKDKSIAEPRRQSASGNHSLPLSYSSSRIPNLRSRIYHSCVISVIVEAVQGRGLRWYTSESNRSVGRSAGYVAAKNSEKRSTDPAYGPAASVSMSPRNGQLYRARAKTDAPLWICRTPCHLRRLSSDGITYTPVGHCPSARNASLVSQPGAEIAEIPILMVYSPADSLLLRQLSGNCRGDMSDGQPRARRYRCLGRTEHQGCWCGLGLAGTIGALWVRILSLVHQCCCQQVQHTGCHA